MKIYFAGTCLIEEREVSSEKEVKEVTVFSFS